VKAAKPARDYDPRFGAEKGFWTTRQVCRGGLQKPGCEKI